MNLYTVNTSELCYYLKKTFYPSIPQKNKQQEISQLPEEKRLTDIYFSYQKDF